MDKRSKVSKDLKIKACEDYIAEKGTFTSIARELGVHRKTVCSWYLRYCDYGADALEPVRERKTYNETLKKTVVKSYLDEEYSLAVLAAKYKISVFSISKWLEKYYHDNEPQRHNLKGDTIMKYRKTTFEERLEIVQWIIENDMNCKEAASKFNIGYTTARKWLDGYLKEGAEALKHKSPGRKAKEDIDESSLSEVDRLKLELERERALRKRREFELEVLKKKEAFERKNRYRK